MTQVAYGDRAIPKINRELQATELIVRQRALVGLCDMLHGKPRALYLFYLCLLQDTF